jgi:ankyrin repeat protein
MDKEGPTKSFHSAAFKYERTGAGKLRSAGGPLHCAVHHGNVDLIRLLIERGADVDSRTTFYKETPIHWAARLGKIECLKLLASYGGCLTAKDGTREGMAPVHLAILSGEDRTALWLLENGVSVNTESRSGITPLFCAIRRRNIQLVKILKEKGSNVNAYSVNMDGITPLHAAVLMKSTEIVKFLLENGADMTTFCSIRNQTPFHWAATVGNLDVFVTMFKYNADISVQTGNEKWDRPIDLAARKGHASLVEWLIENGISVESTNQEGYTPLHTAACYGEIGVVKVLLHKGVDVNIRTKNKERNTALHLSAGGGHVELTKLLLQMGAEIDAEDETNKYTAMHYAAQKNRLQCLIELDNYGDNRQVNTDSKYGETLIATAAKYDSVDVLDWLLDKGVPLNIQGKGKLTPLHYAAYYDSRNVTLILLTRGADVNSRDYKLRTPLIYAVLTGHSEITALLISNQADAYTEDIDKMNAMHCAAMTGELPCLKVLSLGNNISPPSGNKYGDFPIHLAAAFGHVNVVEWLLDRGYPVDVRNNMGSTPLINAAWGGHYDLAIMLIGKDADVNAKVGNADNRSVLHSASSSGNVDLVELLLQKGAVVNARTSTDKRTPLHWAIRKGHLETARLLVKYGADTTAQDAHGFTVKDIAYSKGFVEILSFLSSLDHRQPVNHNHK